MEYIDDVNKSGNEKSDNSLLLFLAGVIITYLLLRPHTTGVNGFYQNQPVYPSQYPIQQYAQSVPARYDNDERYHVIRGEDGFIVDLEVKREAEVK